MEKEVIVVPTYQEMKQVSRYVLSVPSKWRGKIVCTDQCDTCPLAQRGCARTCVRFPDKVCSMCPCRASAFAGAINGE